MRQRYNATLDEFAQAHKALCEAAREALAAYDDRDEYLLKTAMGKLQAAVDKEPRDHRFDEEQSR